MKPLDLRATQPRARRRERAVCPDDFGREGTDQSCQIGEAYPLPDQERDVRMAETR